MPLTDVQIRKAKPADKPYRLTDGGGLFLAVSVAGGKVWRLRYELNGKEQQLTIGDYPAMSLQEARDVRSEKKKLLKAGKDPAKAVASEPGSGHADRITFESMARKWYGNMKDRWSETHKYDVLRSLERDVFPALGEYDIRDISIPKVLEVLQKIENRPAIETAKRVRQRMSDVFVFAIASGICTHDPAAVVVKALKPLVKGKQPAIVDLKQAREMLRKVDETPAHPANKLAMRLLALTALRPGTLIQTPWSELEGISRETKNPTWVISAERQKLPLAMKKKEEYDFLCPLARQAVEVIEALRKMTGKLPFVIPNGRHAHKHASENALGYLLNRAGYHHRHCPHGWRSTFSTIMNERYRADRLVIDLMLGHLPGSKEGQKSSEFRYNRAEHMERRRDLAQIWADLIMEGQMPLDEVVKAPRRGAPMPLGAFQDC